MPPVEERALERAARRLLVLPLHPALCIVLGLLLPVLLPLAWIADRLSHGRRALAATLAFLWVYLACETWGVLVGIVLWRPRHRRDARFLTRHYALQRTWARALFRSAARLFDFRLQIEGDPVSQRGPVVVFIRHASLADTLLPAMLLPHLHLRYVLKRELLWDPCLDLVGQRLPNVFVRRGGEDTAGEIARLAALASDLGADDGVLIYPEGTRFTPAKHQRRVLEIAVRDPGRVARVEAFRRVLPPRCGGALALLRAAPAADVLFVAHVGFEGVTTAADLWRGTLGGQMVRVACWRVPRAEIPDADGARLAWLDAEWARMDAWIVAHEAVEPGPAYGVASCERAS